MVKGCVLDRSNDEPLLFAKVVVQGTSDSAVADMDGCFGLTIHADPREVRLVLLIEYLGFDPYTKAIRPRDLKRARRHRLTRKRYGPHISEAKIKALEERLAVLK